MTTPPASVGSSLGRAAAGRLVIAVVTALVLLAGSLPVSGAHTINADGKWYFRGTTYTNDRSEPKDPVNVIFKGGGTVSNDLVRTHMAHHFETPLGPFWRDACGGNQRMVWSRPDFATTSDKQDFQMGSKGLCPFGPSSRWHFRGWDDQEHKDHTANHGAYSQWVVGSVHKDEYLTHEPDIDWDVARRFIVDTMPGHCSWDVWRRHPGARGWWGGPKVLGEGFRSSGRIARISMRPAPNC